MNRGPHVIATVALSGTVAVMAFAEPFGLPRPDAWLVAAGALTGVVFHPDLDQSKTLYGWVRKHRGLSHWPLIGTLDRLLWFVGPALVAWLLAGRDVDWAGLALLAAGLCLSDLLHTVMDWMEKRWKRWLRKT